MMCMEQMVIGKYDYLTEGRILICDATCGK